MTDPMTAPVPAPVTASDPPGDDPLVQAAHALDSLADAPLDQHPEVFTRFDALLRQALDSPAQRPSG